MSENEIRIRIAEEGLTFVYSIWRSGKLMESAEVRPLGAPVAEGPEVEVLAGYYGGSEVMD
jgi:hypothetical protein